MEGLEEYKRLDEESRRLAFSKFVKRQKVPSSRSRLHQFINISFFRKNSVIPRMMVDRPVAVVAKHETAKGSTTENVSGILGITMTEEEVEPPLINARRSMTNMIVTMIAVNGTVIRTTESGSVTICVLIDTETNTGTSDGAIPGSLLNMNGPHLVRRPGSPRRGRSTETSSNRGQNPRATMNPRQK